MPLRGPFMNSEALIDEVAENENTPEDDAAIGEAMGNDAFQFFIRTCMPCWAEYRQFPAHLMHKARHGDINALYDQAKDLAEQRAVIEAGLAKLPDDSPALPSADEIRRRASVAFDDLGRIRAFLQDVVPLVRKLDELAQEHVLRVLEADTQRAAGHVRLVVQTETETARADGADVQKSSLKKPSLTRSW